MSASAHGDPVLGAGEVEPGGEPGVGLLVARVLGVAALVVAASAALFVGLGALGSDDAPVVADAPEEPEEAEPDPDPPPVTPDPDEPEEPEPDAGTDEDASAPEDDADADEGAPDEPSGDAAEEAEATEEDDTEEDPDPDADEPDRIDPGSISVQVLDGFQQDGGAAADAVAAELSDAGYRIVAQNPALRYDVTAVLWTAGNEAAGQQIAREIGAAEIRQQPGSLSTSVMVHVVVGADRG